MAYRYFVCVSFLSCLSHTEIPFSCFYGVGVTLSPYLMSLALSNQNNWRGGYRAVSYIQAAIALLAFLSLPLWKKAAGPSSCSEKESSRLFPFHVMIKNASIRTVWFIFFTSCAIENIAGIWGSSFLVSAKGLSAGHAAQVITLYYVGMAIGRFLSGILSLKVSSWKLIFLGQGIILPAILLLMLPLASFTAGAGFFIIGLGVGPIFPNLIHRTPKNFGTDTAQSVMGTQMAATYLGIMSLPPLFGLLAQSIGLGVFPYFLSFLFAGMAAATLILVTLLKKQKRY